MAKPDSWSAGTSWIAADVHGVTDKRFYGMDYDWASQVLTIETLDGRAYRYERITPVLYYCALAAADLSFFLSGSDSMRTYSNG